MKVIQKPVTFEAEQFFGVDDVPKIAKILEGTGVSFIGSGRTRLQWPGTGFYENGPDIRVWEDDWVVVSSTGEVRKLTPKEYEAEFYEHWEKDLTPAEEVVVLRGQVAFLAEHVSRMLSDTGGWYNTEDMITLKKIKDNDW